MILARWPWDRRGGRVQVRLHSASTLPGAGVCSIRSARPAPGPASPVAGPGGTVATRGTGPDLEVAAFRTGPPRDPHPRVGEAKFRGEEVLVATPEPLRQRCSCAEVQDTAGRVFAGYSRPGNLLQPALRPGNNDTCRSPRQPTRAVTQRPAPPGTDPDIAFGQSYQPRHQHDDAEPESPALCFLRVTTGAGGEPAAGMVQLPSAAGWAAAMPERMTAWQRLPFLMMRQAGRPPQRTTWESFPDIASPNSSGHQWSHSLLDRNCRAF